MGSKKRPIVQIISTITTNGYIKGFAEGNIYRGKIKGVCVPGLNCYSCPGALGSCPIGSLQAVLGSLRFKFSFYIIGFIAFLGILFGRFICGWLCPFGFIQELLYKIPLKKLKVRKKVHNILKYMKYLILVVFVFLLPLLLVDEIGMGSPYFCKLICPAGTLEGGIPMVLLNKSLRDVVGLLYAWKITILIVIILLSMMIFRPFCKYLCPLGAMYALFNKVSFYQLTLDSNKCTSCKACSKVCKMNVEAYRNPNDPECIRCGDCVKVCKSGALHCGYSLKVKEHEGNR